MRLLYGRAGRLTALFGGFRPGQCHPGALPRTTVTASNVDHECARDRECAVPLPAGLCCVPITAVGWSYLPLDGIVNSAMIWLNTSTFRTLGRSNGHNRIIVNLSASNALAAFFQLYWFLPIVEVKFDLCFIEAIGNQVPAQCSDFTPIFIGMPRCLL